MNKLVRTAGALTLMALGATANADLSDVPSGKYSLDLHHAYISFSYSHMGFSTPNLGFREFDATLALEAEPLTAASMNRALRRFPLMTAKVAAAIYWQAFKLFLKRVPYYPHPGTTLESGASNG